MILDHFPTLKGLILDMDGVIWRGNEAIGNLPAIFSEINRIGLDFVFATNNSAKTIEEYQEKLRSIGLDVESRQILTSAVATFLYLQENHPNKKNLFIIGSDSFKSNAVERGFNLVSAENNLLADFVIVGLDTNLNYDEIKLAANQIFEGAIFLATNADPTYPTPHGPIPGAGVMVAAVKTASGTEPIVIGKPSANMYRQAVKTMQLEPDQVLCVGDRLITDILGAHNGGFHSAFVLSGVNTLDDLALWEPKPDIVAKDLETLING